MADAVRNLDIVTRLKGATESKAGFDGMSVSAKDLQTRIRDLDMGMKKLVESLGKHAYETKRGVIITRERKLALEQLLAIEEKEQVITQKSIRGMGSLSSAAIAATGSVSGLGTGVSVLTNSLMSGVGLSGVLAVAVVSLSLFMEILRSSKEAAEEAKREMDKLTESVEKYSKSTTMSIVGGIQTKITKRESELRSKIAAIGGSGADQEEAYLRITGSDAELNSLKEKLKVYTQYLNRIGWELNLKNEIAELEALRLGATKEVAANLTKIIDAKRKELDATTKITKETKEHNKQLKVGMDLLIDSYMKRKEMESMTKGRIGGVKISGTFGMSSVSIPESPVVSFTKKEMEEQYGLYADLFKDAADVMRSEFGSAWESIFGDANSLFEKLIASWASTLFTKLGNSFGGAILDLLPGGGAIADLLGLSKAVKVGNDYATKLRLE